MNKWLIIGICALVIIGMVIVLIFCKESNKELKLTYKMSAGIPFKRIYEIEDETIVECIKSYVSKDENTGGKVGAPVYTTYVFKGLKEGTTTVTFKVVNIDNSHDVMSENKNIIKVDKDLNIFLVEGENK